VAYFATAVTYSCKKCLLQRPLVTDEASQADSRQMIFSKNKNKNKKQETKNKKINMNDMSEQEYCGPML
jgi:hypothetical protein